jgi:hypothetical protein
MRTVLTRTTKILVAALAVAGGVGVAQAQQQITFDSTHKATTITGTWSTGSKAVTTGSVSDDFLSSLEYELTGWLWRT